MNMPPEWVIYTDNAPTAPALPPLFHPTFMVTVGVACVQMTRGKVRA